jgi:hypothetical protein
MHSAVLGLSLIMLVYLQEADLATRSGVETRIHNFTSQHKVIFGIPHEIHYDIVFSNLIHIFCLFQIQSA